MDNVEKIAELAHKINTPLSTINGYIAMIEKTLEDTKKTEDKKRWIETIKQELKKITDYTKEIQKSIPEVK